MIYHLRLDIIKAQICMKSYFKWRNDCRDYNSNTVKNQFQKMLLDKNVMAKYGKKRANMEKYGGSDSKEEEQ